LKVNDLATVIRLKVFRESSDFMTVLGTAKPPVLGTEKPLIFGTRKPHFC